MLTLLTLIFLVFPERPALTTLISIGTAFPFNPCQSSNARRECCCLSETVSFES